MVRQADDAFKEKLEAYTKRLESLGHTVHLPHRDTNQNNPGLQICKDNFDAIDGSHQVHIFYNSKSTGVHFDMGMAFAIYNLFKDIKIKVIENEPFNEQKSFAKLLHEWEEEQNGNKN